MYVYTAYSVITKIIIQSQWRSVNNEQINHALISIQRSLSLNFGQREIDSCEINTVYYAVIVISVYT